MTKNIVTAAIILTFGFCAGLSAQNINKPNISGPAGLKVNSFSGGLFYQRTDLVIPGKGPSIDLTFSYNSFNTALDYGFGPGWTMTYNMLYEQDSTGIIIRRSDGRKDLFTFSSSAYHAPVGIFDTLVKYEPDKFRLTTKTGMKYFFEDSTHKRLTKISDPNNNELTISYTSGLPTAIIDASGRRVSLNYTAGHLTNMTDTNFVPARHITYVNDSTGNPVSFINTLGDTVFKYEYDPVRNMTKLTQRSQNTSRTIENFEFNINYLNCVNVVEITSPLNNMTITFDTTQKETTVTEPNDNGFSRINQSTSYKFNAQGNLEEKMGNCCGFHLLYSYDAQNNISQRTDANGNIYTYTHDAKGNTTQETHPLSGVMSYVYEPLFNRITSVTDKNGNPTIYSYDANGNLITVSKPSGTSRRSMGITEHYTYDAYGNVISYTDGRGYTTTYAYNAHGDRILITYPDAATNSFTYDNVGNRLTSTDANGHTTTYEYDKLNRLKKTTDALGNMTTYSYDTRSNLTSVTDALGHITTYTYDALNRRTSTTTPAGTSYMTYNEKGNVLTSTDNNGNVTNYSYNTQNLLATETNALGHSRSFTYDANGNRLTETDYNNYTSTYKYDSLNRTTHIINAFSDSTVFGYDANGNRVSVKDANNHTTSYVYDSLNRLREEHRPIGITVYEYDANNNRTKVTDPNNHATRAVYDSRNRARFVINALGDSVAYTYDLQGNLKVLKNRNGFETHYTYDALNRQDSIINPLGETTIMTYDSVGRVLSRKDPGGNIIQNGYDAADRLISVSDNIGPVATYAYDANGNRIKETNALGDSIVTGYDALDRVKSVKDPLGKILLYHYDKNSNLDTLTDRNGHITVYKYDSLNREIQITYPAGNNVKTTYDPVGNVVSKTDDNNRTTVYEYDANDRKIKETFANSTFKSFAYDNAGNLVRRIDNKGDTTIYIYDAVDRLTYRDYPLNDDRYFYDKDGRMYKAENDNAEVQFEYDNADRVTKERRGATSTNYTYNTAGRKRTITYPSTGVRTIEENYDYRNRLSLIKDNFATLATYTYDLADRMLSRTLSNGITTSYTNNKNGWVSNLNHTGVAQFNYTFDDEGNRLSAQKLHHTSNSEKYTYDADDRLTNYKEGLLTSGNIPSPVTQTQFNYDGVGNRTTMVKDAVTTSYSVDSVNAYTNITGGASVTPVYDLNGNLVNDGIHTYEYDYENRLIRVPSTGIYKYDALGRRTRRETSGGSFYYYYDGDRIIEIQNSGSLLYSFVYGTWIDDVINMGDLGGSKYFYHANSLGSVVAITNTAGTVVERYEYDAYGKPSVFNGAYSPLTSSAIGNAFMFTGREYDAESGNYHYRARFYKPDWGRFGQWDPIGIWGDEINIGNGYGYLGDNVVNYTDPLGKDTYVGSRKIGGKEPKPKNDILRHDFIFTTKPDGTLDHTFSWGNSGMTWHMDTPEDIAAANSMLQDPCFDNTFYNVGVASLEPFIHAAFSCYSTDIHINLMVCYNCKTEVIKLIKKAKELQDKHKEKARKEKEEKEKKEREAKEKGKKSDPVAPSSPAPTPTPAPIPGVMDGDPTWTGDISDPSRNQRNRSSGGCFLSSARRR